MPARPDHRCDGGFTLIELLVVMVIIGILAAIAIPTFVNQRSDGYRTAMKSDLRNAAISAESLATSSGGDYGVVTTAALDAQRGTGVTAAVTLVVAASGTDGYCLAATHTQLPAEPYFYDSRTGAPSPVDCSGAAY